MRAVSDLLPLRYVVRLLQDALPDSRWNERSIVVVAILITATAHSFRLFRLGMSADANLGVAWPRC